MLQVHKFIILFDNFHHQLISSLLIGLEIILSIDFDNNLIHSDKRISIIIKLYV